MHTPLCQNGEKTLKSLLVLISLRCCVVKSPSIPILPPFYSCVLPKIFLFPLPPLENHDLTRTKAKISRLDARAPGAGAAPARRYLPCRIPKMSKLQRRELSRLLPDLNIFVHNSDSDEIYQNICNILKTSAITQLLFQAMVLRKSSVKIQSLKYLFRPG